MAFVADQAAEAKIDHALVARVLLADDRRAFEQLVRRHQGLVRAQLRRLVHGDHAEADDLAQEAFIMAWRKLHQFRGEARFSTWLYRIAYSCFLQARRKHSFAGEDIEGDSIDRQASPRETPELRFDIERAMQRLSASE